MHYSSRWFGLVACVALSVSAGCDVGSETSGGSGGDGGTQATAGSSAGGTLGGSAGASGSGGSSAGSGASGSGGQATGGVASTSGGTGGGAGTSGAGGTASVSPRERLLQKLTSLSGDYVLSGQHNREPNSSPAKWTDAIHDTTGKYPALWSGDFLFQQDNIDHRWDMIAEAKRQAEAGAVVDIMWHACPPNTGDPCGWDSNGVLSHLSDSDWADLITPGSELQQKWIARLDEIAVYLQDLEDAGVAILFRPLHEMNQGAFWWGGRPGPDGTRRLYQITHDYLVKTKGLDNLVWIWDVQDLSWDFADYSPGADYFDVAALDVYGDGYTTAKYQAMLDVSEGKPIAIGECQRLPTAAELEAQPRWVFFMAWAELVYDYNSDDEIRALYSSPRVLTRDEL